MMKFKSNTVLKAAAALATLGLVAAPAMAQRDPAYQAARTAGQVGEQMDGYLGTVGSVPAAITTMVNEINIQRKKVYSNKAAATKVTVEDFAFGAGCQNIRDTAVGEKYQTPGGAWATRTAAPPQRDPRCP